MTIQECYETMGADFAEVIGRLRSERLIQKFALKFLDDGSYDLLCSSLEAGNHDEAFRAAHTIKGVCQNLGFTELGKSSSELTEALRGDSTSDVSGLVEKVRADYEKTVGALKAFRDSQ